MFSDAKHIIHYMWIHCCEQNQGLEEVKLLQAMTKKKICPISSSFFPTKVLDHNSKMSQDSYKLAMYLETKRKDNYLCLARHIFPAFLSKCLDTRMQTQQLKWFLLIYQSIYKCLTYGKVGELHGESTKRIVILESKFK